MQGYYGRPAETASAFIQNPFSQGREDKLYCTGDWVRLTLEHLGPRLVAAGLASADDVERCLAFLADPGSWYLPPVMVTAWGRRPATYPQG